MGELFEKIWHIIKHRNTSANVEVCKKDFYSDVGSDYFKLQRQEEKQYKEEHKDEYEKYKENCAEVWEEPCEFENSADRLKCLKMDLEQIDRVIAKFRLAFSLYKEQLEKEQRQFLKERQLVGEKLVRLNRKLNNAYHKINQLKGYEAAPFEKPPSPESGIDASDIPPKGC